ncbi:MAG: hypothetical protein AAFP69_03785 [Planctomycetota bacterium]
MLDRDGLNIGERKDLWETLPAVYVDRWEPFDEFPDADEHGRFGVRYEYDFQDPPS